MLALLDKVGEEERGVADDASGPGLLMLTALQDKPIVHVALRMQAGLDQDTHKYAFDHYNRPHHQIYKAMKQSVTPNPSVNVFLADGSVHY